MNAFTLAAAFGILILIFQDGRFESLFSYTSEGALDLTIPLVPAALVFAISTDYGVFLLSRVREARSSGQSGREAISSSVAVVGASSPRPAILFAAPSAPSAPRTSSSSRSSASAPQSPCSPTRSCAAFSFPRL
jgi:uncharacterized membrane protein YdfJ with MMPL/SSD domain